MASGTTYGSSQLLNPHSKVDLNSLKKLKRKISNRESARRSRMRKQRHLGELTGEVSRLRREKSQLTSSFGVAKQLCTAVEAENSVLRAQVMELGRRLQTLSGMLGYAGGRCRLGGDGFFSRAVVGGGRSQATAWSSVMCTEQPVMASAGDMLYH